MNTIINHPDPVLGGDLDLAGRPTFSSSSNLRHPICWNTVFQICKKRSVFSNEKDYPTSQIKVQKECAVLQQLCMLHLTILLVHLAHMQTVYISWTFFLFS